MPSLRMSQDAAASPRSSPASHELEQPASTASAIAADDQGGPPDRGLEGTSPGSDPSRYAQSKWALLAATVALSVAYAPNFRDLLSVWEADPNYSHGYLIIPIALVILWRRLSDKREEGGPTWVGPRWWGWIVLCAVLALCAIAYERASQWVETATIVPVIACLTWTLGGWPLVRVAWPAILFLVFLFPLPPGVNDSVALPLQRIAATGSCFLLQLTGLWAVQEGNVIHLATPHGNVPLDVALACNGLRMLMTMAATITAVIVLIAIPTWQRLTLLASTVPIALLSNMIRIVVTGWCFYLFTGAEAKHWACTMSPAG